MTDATNKTPLETALVNAMLSETRATRRWKNIRFFVWLALFLGFITFLFMPQKSEYALEPGVENYVALLHLTGTIMPNNTFSVSNVLPELNRAFRDKKAKGVVLLINSPGGSPVQASIIHDKIMQLKAKYHKEVIVVAEDVLASGAYLVATAADKIFVNKDTVTGSIGVIMEGFGFEDAINKIGVTRRVFTAGGNKDRLDPFVAMKPEDKVKIQHILDSVHQDFINDVVEGRKGKLSQDTSALFSGDFWTGTQAVQLGLADGTANIWEALENTFHTTHYRNYTPRESFWHEVMKDMTRLHVFFTQSDVQLKAQL